ncbi:phosphoenolpyruvate synthase [Klebsiella pneumoniae]|uniref:Phosphoenolpyruvate synthase n=1 Tax=Klebsiella pneumoniae TaxID=573 RepID=A0A377V837_KLEPN|nr:phosphoenolpyruvate synthase [Klebsiella pneumoniae]
MTQLALGLDRDSGVVSELFDERNDAVKALLSMAIRAAKKQVNTSASAARGRLTMRISPPG